VEAEAKVQHGVGLVWLAASADDGEPLLNLLPREDAVGVTVTVPMSCALKVSWSLTLNSSSTARYAQRWPEKKALAGNDEMARMQRCSAASGVG
jgi:hypothetical protein